jgi:ATP-dependent Clp protease ATP-binding subunit ClpX
MIPELVGRLPVIAALQPLAVADLMKILKEPKNAIIKQYQAIFEMDGIDLEFEEGAVEAIAAAAYSEKTGARGLRSIIENIMLEIMFKFPNKKTPKNVLLRRMSS